LTFKDFTMIITDAIKFVQQQKKKEERRIFKFPNWLTEDSA